MCKMKRSFFLFLSVLFSILFTINVYAASQSWDNVSPEDVEYTEMTAQVMEVNVAEEYLIVGDKKFYLVEGTKDGKQYKTKLLNGKNKVVPFKFFKKGQIVVAIGLKVPDGRNAAVIIKKLSANEKKQLEKGLKFDSAKFMHEVLDNVKSEDNIDPRKFRRLVDQYGGKGNK